LTELKKLTPADGGSQIIAYLSLEGEDTVYGMLLQDYAQIKSILIPGVIPDELAETLKLFDARCRAVKKGRALLEYGSNSRNGLIGKLCKRGFSKEVSVYAADMLLSESIIDESRDALRDAERMIGRGFGKKRILSGLLAKGYCRDAVKAAEDSMEDVDFSVICLKVIRKKWHPFPEEKEDVRKAVAALMRLGFSSSDIKEALKAL